MEVQKIKVADAPKTICELLRNGLAFGLLYFPEDQIFKVSVCKSTDVISIQSISGLNENGTLPKPGFVVLPFDKRSHNGYFLPHSIEINRLEPTINNLPFKQEISTSSKPKSTTPSIYKANVEKAAKEIREGKFEKLVVSRIKDSAFDPERMVDFLEKMIQRNPQANLCFVNLPDKGFWVSATPEVLIENIDNKAFKTMALAGTLKYDGKELKGQGWTEKEIEEQALVSRYIKNCLKATGNHYFEEKGPFTIQAGNLLHLRTDFTIKSESLLNFGNLADALHPTSAVCGSPRDEAFDWIRDHEQFDREFFSGCAGIIEPEYAKLVVLLRAGKIAGDMISLYAGAGITASSKAENEWNETEEKLKTIGKYLQNKRSTVL